MPCCVRMGTVHVRLCPRGVFDPRAVAASFSDCAGDLADISTPVQRQRPARHVLMEAAVGPIRNTGHQSVLDRIEVDVIGVAFQVVVVANDVFPIPTLPDAFFSPGNLAAGAVRCGGKSA